MRYRFHILDVFSAEPFGGNQLAVLPDARGLGGEGMQLIAREFNFPESTFVLPAAHGHEAAVRIFTPATELPFAGHPIVGTAALLVSLGLAEPGRLVLELGVGPIAVDVRAEGDGFAAAFIREGAPELRPAHATPAQLAQVLSLPAGSVRDCFDASAGLAFCFIRLADREAVDRARLDASAWSSHLAGSWAPNVFLFAGAPDDGAELYARMFAPAFGIPEDPATGSACVALAGIAAERSGRADGVFALRILQGVAMGRRSEIAANATIVRGAVASVSVGGAAARVAEGEIDIPARYLDG